MFKRYFNRSSLAGCCFALLLTAGGSALAADHQFAPPADGKKIQLTASFKPPADGKPGTLTITADIAEGFYIYATTQGPGGGKPATIDVASSKQFRLVGAFVADPKAEKKFDDIFKVEVQTHRGRVQWTAPLELLDGAKADQLTISGKLSVQVCNENVCINMTIDFAARQDGGKKAPAEKSVRVGGKDAAGLEIGPTPAARRDHPGL